MRVSSYMYSVETVGVRPSVQKKMYMSKDAVDHLWSFVDGHHCPYPSVTVSMDVTVALTIH